MPSYNGKVSGRVDADTFRVLKGTRHPDESFKSCTIGHSGVPKLIVGSADAPAAYALSLLTPNTRTPGSVSKNSSSPGQELAGCPGWA